MTVEHNLWDGVFEMDDIPHFVCPKCKQGRLGMVAGTLSILEPAFSELARQHPKWRAEWIEQRVAFRMQCTLPKCGEIANVVGKTVDHHKNELRQVKWRIKMHGIHPAPPIMTMPPGMPTPVEEAIEASFALYWVDVGAAASKLRASVERLMDHYKITKTRLRPTGGKNKRVPLELASRIDKFISAMQPDISAKTLHALRIVGNLGTHDTVTSYVLLQAFEVYEDTLRVLIGKHSKNIERLVKRIHARKGRP